MALSEKRNLIDVKLLGYIYYNLYDFQWPQYIFTDFYHMFGTVCEAVVLHYKACIT